MDDLIFIAAKVIVGLLVATILLTVIILKNSIFKKEKSEKKNGTENKPKSNNDLWITIIDFFLKKSKTIIGFLKNKKSNDNPVGVYHKGAGNHGYQLAIVLIAISATFFLVLWGKEWFTIPAHKAWLDVWRNYLAISGTIFGITTVWIGAIVLISDVSEIEAGWVGLVTAFGKYSGTVYPGFFFKVRGINKHVKVYTGNQMLGINLTEKNGGSINSFDGTPIGVRGDATFIVISELAHRTIFNTAGKFQQYLRVKIESLLRDFLSCYSFEQVNTLKGNRAMVAIFSKNYLDKEGKTIPFANLGFAHMGEEEVRKQLKDSWIWQAIRRDWGIEVIDLNIIDFDLPENMKKSRENQFIAEQNLLTEKKNVEIAEQLKKKRITAAEAKEQEIVLENSGFAKGIRLVMDAANTSGEQVLEFTGKRLKYESIANGANAILSDSVNGSRFMEEGVGFGAGEQMWLNRNKTQPENNGSNKGMPNVERNNIVRPGAGEGEAGK
jgi:regulator of protease activity HflC (stomatin/prohibitin superfamily)